MSLLALQQDFRCWLTTESAEAGERLESGDGAGRSVYLNNYRASLMGCLAESFPITRAWLGDDGFASASARHIDRVSPQSWTLDDYAIGLPETLEAVYLADPEVADLARIELALSVAFVGRDADAIDLATLAGVDWDDAVLRFVPTLALVPVSTNAIAIWSAISNGEPPPAVETLLESATVAVWLAGVNSAFRTLEIGEKEPLKFAIGGGKFGALCAQLVDRHGERQGTEDAGYLLSKWLQDGIIADVG